MGSSHQTASPRFLELFRQEAGPEGVLRFDAFMQLALYHPTDGYYRRSRPRVGRGPGTDFYTASSSGPIFGELVVAACRSLMAERELARCTFVEIGAEPGGGVLAGLDHPFAGARTIGCAEPIGLEGGCIVFSNELFDAQPFRRFLRRGNRWLESAVRLQAGGLEETFLPGENLPSELPATASEGYIIDAPCASLTLLDLIVRQPWHGLFITCDYGRRWAELTEATPAGTARAYHAHVQSNRLLDRPGEQDLTCHICWDWLEAGLHRAGFPASQLESHEAFFIRHAASFIGDLVAAEAGRFSPRKQALQQLLHPAHLGQKFQVLHATRRE